MKIASEDAVLIETLWNVKIFQILRDPIYFVVLIETLWNVKISSGILPPPGDPRINRNIVECKGRR